MTPLGIAEAAVALRRGETTSAELVERAIAAAHAVDADLGCFVTRFEDGARAGAAMADAELAAGADRGPLHGIPLGIKDIITTADGPTTGQSLVLDREWGGADAPVAARLRAAGAVVVGKTTTMEFAIGAPDTGKPFPVPRNPWDRERWAGGSSSGSASAVATGAVLGALGTDTAGSIRIPSAFCGITGLKPSFDLVPKDGCVPLSYTQDHIGPMAGSARDCALLLATLAGDDPRLTPDLGAPGDGLAGLRIGVDRLTRYSAGGEDPAFPAVFDAALAVLTSLGARLVELELPAYEELNAAARVIMACEALAYHLPDLRTRWLDYFAGTRQTVASGAFYSGADYVQAQRVRRVGQQALARACDEVDLVVTPTASCGATPLADLDALAEVVASGALGPVYTPYWDVVGLPVLTVPIGFTADGLPLGLQIAGPAFADPLVLRAGQAYQQVTDWHRRRPPVPEAALVDS